MLNLILHSLKMRKVQTASVILSVAMSVMTLLALGLVYGGVTAGVAASEARGGAELMVVPRDAAASIDGSALLFTGAPAPIYLPQSVAEEVGATRGVARSTSQFFSQTLNESCCSTTGATRLIGVDFSTDWTVAPFAHGDPAASVADGGVIVGADIGGNVGERLVLLGNVYTIADKLEPSGTDLDDAILLDIDAARAISSQSPGLSYLWDKYGHPEDIVSCVLVDYAGDADASERTAVRNRLTALDGVAVIERSAVVASAQKQLEAVFAIMLGAGALMLASTLVQLFARFYSCVWERKAELALYRAIGANRGQLRALIGGEVALLVGAGFAVGLAGGAALYAGLMGLLEDAAAFPFIGLGAGEAAVLVALLAAVFAALAVLAVAAPLVQIGRLDPSLAMQQGDID